MSLGPPIRPPVVTPEAKWEPVPGKPHLIRHSITKKTATHIPANEGANGWHPYGWPVIPPVPTEEES